MKMFNISKIFLQLVSNNSWMNHSHVELAKGARTDASLLAKSRIVIEAAPPSKIMNI